MSRADVKSGRQWLADHGWDSCLYAQPNLDGLAAAALLSRRAVGDITFVDPFGDHLNRTRAMIIIDQGVKPVHSPSPVLYVDRHQTSGRVKGTLVNDPDVPAVSLLAWRLIEMPAADRWLAALGMLDNGAGPDLPHDTLDEPERDLRRLAALCTASPMLRGTPIKAVFTMLMESHSLSDALSHPHAARLEHVRQTVQDLALEAAGTRPELSERAALVELDLPARVQSRLANAWAKRLAPLPVVVANLGWRAQQVEYSIRCADPDHLDEWLAQVNASRSLAHGREAYALDGALSLSAYERFRSLVVDGVPQAALRRR